MIEKLFLYAVAALEVGAIGGYAYSGSYRLAFIWACYALATIALAGVAR